MIDVLIVDDERLIRDGFRRLLELSTGLRVVGEAANGEEALAFLERMHVAVMLLDVRMPRVNGLAVLDALKPRAERPACLVLTTFDDLRVAAGGGAPGGAGFLSKDVSLEELVSAIKVLASGASWFQPTLTASLRRAVAYRRNGESSGLARHLTDREIEVLRPHGRRPLEPPDRCRPPERRRHRENQVSSILSKVACKTGCWPSSKQSRQAGSEQGVPQCDWEFSRRRWLQAAGASALWMGCSSAFAGKAGAKERLEEIRKRIGGRLGVHVLDYAYRATHRVR